MGLKQTPARVLPSRIYGKTVNKQTCVVSSPLSVWCLGLLVLPRAIAIGWHMLVVDSIGHGGDVGIVQVDVSGLGRLAVGVVVVMMVVVVMVSMVVVAVLSHGVGTVQPAHGLLHVGIVRWRVDLQGPLRGISLVPAVRVAVHVAHVVAEDTAIPLPTRTQNHLAGNNFYLFNPKETKP